MFSNVSFILFVDNTDINISTGTLGEHPLLECTLNYALPVHSDLRTTGFTFHQGSLHSFVSYTTFPSNQWHGLSFPFGNFSIKKLPV